MMILGIDAHKRSDTVVAIDGNGTQLAVKTFGTTTVDHLEFVRWPINTNRAALGR